MQFSLYAIAALVATLPIYSSNSSSSNGEDNSAFPRRRNLVAKKTHRPTEDPAHPATGAYPRVNISNETPYFASQAKVYYRSHNFCAQDITRDGIAAGTTYTAPDSRGICLVTKIVADVTLPDGSTLACSSYTSSGTSYSVYSII